jgi:acetylglutamate kinase
MRTTRRVLIKIGGRAFSDEAGFKELAAAIRSRENTEVIIVHGGGAEISQALKAAGRPTEFVDGIRVTHAEDIEIVEGVLSGTVNERIAAWLGNHGVSCERMSGKSDGLFIVEPLKRGGREFGFVGQIKAVNAHGVTDALANGKVPVVSPISGDHAGASYNVNADSAAAVLAGGANCTDLIFITDVPGVLVDDETCPKLTIKEARSLIDAETIQGGMVAKMEAVFEALQCGVSRVHVIEWQGTDTLGRVIEEEFVPGTTIFLR